MCYGREAMIQNDERFKNLASGCQSIMLAVAVLIGGIWTLSTFYLLRQKEQAELDLIQLRKQIETSGAELKKINYELKTLPALNIQITGSSAPLPNGNGWYLLSTVSVQNLGNQTATLDFSQGEPFLIFPVDFSSEGQPIFGNVRKFHVIPGGNPNYPPDTVAVRAETTESFVFGTAVDKPGLYLLSFRVDVAPSDREVLAGGAEEQGRLVRWAASAFTVIPSNSVVDALQN